MNQLAEIFWRIPIDPILVVVLVFFCFIVAGPIAIITAFVLALRPRTRRLGLVMLASGVAGYFCVAAAVALRIRVGSPDWFVSSLTCGLAGFTAFTIIALMIYFRCPTRLTKRCSERPSALRPHFL